jgi:acyl-CoA reductase-like NAD-dependent aldehyde dehydrogenase
MAKPALAKGSAAKPTRYDGFERMPVNGNWRSGSSGRVSEDVDPYTSEVLLRIPLAGHQGRRRVVDIPGKESRVYRQPAGVVGMISPCVATTAIEDFTTVHWVSVQHQPIRYPT